MWSLSLIKFQFSREYVCVVSKPSRELPLCNLKLASLQGGQEETEERGKPFQIGRWQVS